MYSSTMGSIKVILSDEQEDEFREEVFKTMGMKKGNLTLAIAEAIRMWMDAQRQKRSGEEGRENEKEKRGKS